MPTRTNAEILRALRKKAVADGKCQICRCREPKPNCKTCQYCIDQAHQRDLRNRKAGLCPCGRRRRRGMKQCAHCSEIGTRTSRTYMAKRMAKGICRQCPALAETGKRLCATHLAGEVVKQQKLRLDAISKGLCGSCRHRPLKSVTMCRTCLMAMRRKSAARYQAKREAQISTTEICIPKFLPASEASDRKDESMVADAKQWSPPRSVRDFHYYITEVAVAKFRSRSDRAEFVGASDTTLAISIDQRVFDAVKAGRLQDIVDSSCPAETTKIVEIPIRHGGTANYALLRTIRPNAYPPIRTSGGPAGVALGVIDLVPTDQGAENFAYGRWKVAFRQLEGPLTKLLNEQGPHPANDNPTPSPVTTTDKERPMDASPAKRTSSNNISTGMANLISSVKDFGPKAVKVPDVVIPKGKPAREDGKRARRQYTEQYKKQMAKLVVDGQTITEVGEKNELTLSALRAWVLLYYPNKSYPGKGGRVKKTTTKTPTKASTTPVRTYPPGYRSEEATQKRIGFAKAQLAIRPYMNIGGPDGLGKLLKERFGVSLSHDILSGLRTEAIRQVGGNGQTSSGRRKVNAKTGVPITVQPALASTKPYGNVHSPRGASRKVPVTNGVVGLASELGAALAAEQDAKENLAAIMAEMAEAKATYETAKTRATQLLKQMQDARS